MCSRFASTSSSNSRNAVALKPSLQATRTSGTIQNLASRPTFSTCPCGARALYANTGVVRNERQRYRVPTLRNVEITAPYMHDGSVPTLAAVLDHYAAGGRFRGSYTDPRIRPIDLSTDERHDLVEFLRSLTDRDFLSNPQFAAPAR